MTYERTTPMNGATRRVRVMRGVTTDTADLGTVRSQSVRHLVVDPHLVQSATDDGYRAGYQAGFDAGLADAAEAIDIRERKRAGALQTTIATLAQATDDLAGDHANIIDGIESQVVALAIEIARIIVGRELTTTSEPGIDALQRALQLAPDGVPAVAHLHPDDAATLGAQFIDDQVRELSIVIDESLVPGDCIVDINAMRIDARIGGAFERLVELMQ